MLFSSYALRLAQTDRASAEQRFLGNKVVDGGQRGQGQGQGSSTLRYQRPSMQAVFGSPVSTNASLLNPLSDPIFASTSFPQESQGQSLTSELGLGPLGASAFDSHNYNSGVESSSVGIPSLEGEDVAADLQGSGYHSVHGAFMMSQPHLALPLRGVVSPPPFVNVPVTTEIEVNLEAFIQQSTADVNRGPGSSEYSTTWPAAPRYSQYSQPSVDGANIVSNIPPDINIEPVQAVASDPRGVGSNLRLSAPRRTSAINLPPALSEQTGTLFLSQLQNMVPPTTCAASAPSMSRPTGSFQSIRDRLKSSVPLRPISSTKQEAGS